MTQERGLSFEEHDPSHPKGKNYLLAVGIDEYQNFNKLSNAVLDAKTISNLLINNFQFEEQNSRLLLNEEATRENILDTLEDFEKQLTGEDNFLLYFAGHGTMNEKKTQGFWIPVDARRRNSHYIRNTSILDILKDFQAHHIYLLIDSCFSGSLISRKADEDYSDLLDALPSRRVLTSGRKEVVSDGRKGKHSPFAGCIISYLKSKEGEIISSLDLEYHVQKNVKRNAYQHPEAAFMHGLGDQSGQFVFRAKNFEQSEPDSGPAVSDVRSSKRSEAEAYLDAQDEHTIEAYKAFLDDFANGKYKTRAKRAIEKLKASKAKEIKPKPKQKPPTPKGPIEMVLVEGGTFMMGSEDGRDIEKPVHQVHLDSFEIGKYPLTQKQWQDIMGNNPSHFAGENLPVERVSWFDASAFIKKINAKYPGMNYRLPTEAEWEYAARGGNKSKGFPYAGSNDLNEIGWYWENSEEKTHLVGQKKANELGIHDMSGNVFEWCKDFYGAYPSENQTNPKGPDKGDYRVMRGGSWNRSASSCRVSLRFNNIPNDRDFYYGFRLARSL